MTFIKERNVSFCLAVSVVVILLHSFAFAEELVRPLSHNDLPRPTFELGNQIVGAQVEWRNRVALERDFSQLVGLSDDELDAWILKNVCFIGSVQKQLIGIRNTAIPTSAVRKPIFRPRDWIRSGMVEVQDPRNEKVNIGLIDVKGLGHGALSRPSVEEQIRLFQAATSNSDYDAIKNREHSDGLISLGEAIAEAVRQSAAQLLFDYRNLNLETVESYAVIRLPFNILRANGEDVPAALYVRQANVGRTAGLNVPTDVYVDTYGNRQRTDTGTAIDFGGVVITSSDAAALAESPETNPQHSKEWRYAYDTAKAAVRDNNRDYVSSHFQHMLADLTEKCAHSDNCRAKKAKRDERRAFVQKLRAQGLNLVQITERYINFAANKEHSLDTDLLAGDDDIFLAPDYRMREIDLMSDDVILPRIEKTLTSPTSSSYAKTRAVRALRGRNGPNVMQYLDKYINGDVNDSRAAAYALTGRSDSESLDVIKKALSEKVEIAASALAGRKDKESLVVITALIDKGSIRSQVYNYAVEALAEREDAASLPLVERLLRSTQQTVRDAMIQNLGARSDAHSLGLILNSYKYPRRYSQVGILKALGSRDDQASFEIIKEALYKPGLHNEFNAAIEALGHRKDARAFELKREMLLKSSGGVSDYIMYSKCPEILSNP
jgi:hypothetical protein